MSNKKKIFAHILIKISETDFQQILGVPNSLEFLEQHQYVLPYTYILNLGLGDIPKISIKNIDNC